LGIFEGILIFGLFILTVDLLLHTPESYGIIFGLVIVLIGAVAWVLKKTYPNAWS